MNLSILLFASVFLLLIARASVVTVLQTRPQTSTNGRCDLGAADHGRRRSIPGIGAYRDHGCLGFAEAPIQPYRTGLLPFLCPLLLLLCSSGMRKRSFDTSETEDVEMKTIRDAPVGAGPTRDGAR